jgi:hypothetical protein
MDGAEQLSRKVQKHITVQFVNSDVGRRNKLSLVSLFKREGKHAGLPSRWYVRKPLPVSYLGSELPDFGSVLSELGSGVFGRDDELPRSGMDRISELLLTPSFSAVLSSRTPVTGRLLFF